MRANKILLLESYGLIKPIHLTNATAGYFMEKQHLEDSQSLPKIYYNKSQ